MGYFKYLSIGLGLYLLLAGLWIMIQPEQYKNIGESLLAKKRPTWVAMISAAIFAWVGYTWYQFGSYQTPLTGALCLVLSLSLIKVYFVVFKYDQFRSFAISFLVQDNTLIRVFAGLFFALGILIFAISLVI